MYMQIKTNATGIEGHSFNHEKENISDGMLAVYRWTLLHNLHMWLGLIQMKYSSSIGCYEDSASDLIDFSIIFSAATYIYVYLNPT